MGIVVIEYGRYCDVSIDVCGGGIVRIIEDDTSYYECIVINKIYCIINDECFSIVDN